MNDGECDYLWGEHEQLRESSPTYQIGKKLFRKYSKSLYGDVLDIGCGVELWQKSVLANNGNIKSYLGIDSSELVIKKLNINQEYPVWQPSSRFKFKKGDANNLQIDGVFDCIIAWGGHRTHKAGQEVNLLDCRTPEAWWFVIHGFSPKTESVECYG
jgi:SAM-dependent methyltransferase